MAKRKPNRPGRKGVPSRQKARRPKAASGPPKRSSPRSKRAPRAAGGRPGKLVYDFEEGNKEMKYLLGGKGANLAEMTNLGLPVPPGFTITTEVCGLFFAKGGWPEGLQGEVDTALALLEQRVGKKFGDPERPLLVSVRSGAAVSMPGMMDTILNLGLNDITVEGLARASGDPRFAWDSYRRFVTMYGDVVLGIHYTRFHRVEEEILAGRAFNDLRADELKAFVMRLKAVITDAGQTFPEDPRDQL